MPNGRDFEDRIRQQLKYLGLDEARLQPGSGNQRRFKGDIWAPPYLVECKSTSADVLRVSWRWWTKLEDQAARAGLTPVLALGVVRCFGVGYSQGFLVEVPDLDGEDPLCEVWDDVGSHVLRDFRTHHIRWHDRLFHLTQELTV